MRILHFDVAGTILHKQTRRVKPALAFGRLERAIRDVPFDHLVCMGGFERELHALTVVRQASHVDLHSLVFELCGGAFISPDWFREFTFFVDDFENRVSEIEFYADWWYVDDLAEDYCATAGLQNRFEANVGTRILVPDPNGNGAEIIDWLGGIAA